MLVELTYADGKRLRIEVDDPNMTAFLARLNGNVRWIDTNGDNKLYINSEAIVVVEDRTPSES